MIKVIIKIRKNSLFFNNAASAAYSGVILTLLETAVQNEVSVFEYMDYLMKYKNDVIDNPKNYLPWLFKLDKNEKKNYWKRYNKYIKSPSTSLEYQSDQNYHSSA
jgi:hypothetical protein